MSLVLNFVGGIPFQLLYDGVKLAISKTSKFKTHLLDLQTTLDSIQPQIIQNIADIDDQIQFTTGVIQELKTKMEEGILLVDMVLKLSMWNIRIWGNCCNCIGPDLKKQICELDRSLRILLARLHMESQMHIRMLVSLSTEAKKEQGEMNKKVDRILNMLGQSNVYGGTVLNSVQYVASSSGGGASTPAPAPAPALGVAFQQLFNVVIRVNFKNRMLKRLFEEFKCTLYCLQPLIEEIAKDNKILHLLEEEVKNLTEELQNGPELVHKCLKGRKRAYYRKNEYITGILILNNSLHRLFIRLKVQVEKNVKETLDSTNKVKAVIKNIKVDDLYFGGPAGPVEPRSPALVRDVQEFNKMGVDKNDEGTGESQTELAVAAETEPSSPTIRNVPEIVKMGAVLKQIERETAATAEPHCPSPVVGLTLDSASNTKVGRLKQSVKEKEAVSKHLKSRGNVGITHFKKLFRRNNSCGERKKSGERTKRNAVLWIIPSNCNKGSKVLTFCSCIKPFQKLSDETEMIMQATFPDECIDIIISLTTPADACRLSSVSRSFKSAAESDKVWENFLPSPHLIHSIQSQSTSSATVVPAKSKKEIYLALCDNPVLIDNGKMSFSLDKWSGKKCYMICARELFIVWAENKSYWTWISLAESRFEKVASLESVCWLEIRGKIDMSILSPSTLYKAYLVYKLTKRAYGFSVPVEVTVAARPYGFEYGDLADTLADGNKQTVYLDPKEIIDGARRPNERADGWLEMELGEFLCQAEEDGELEMVCAEFKNLCWKEGLIVQGIEVRPERKEYFETKGKAISSYFKKGKAISSYFK